MQVLRPFLALPICGPVSAHIYLSTLYVLRIRSAPRNRHLPELDAALNGECIVGEALFLLMTVDDETYGFHRLPPSNIG